MKANRSFLLTLPTVLVAQLVFAQQPAPTTTTNGQRTVRSVPMMPVRTNGSPARVAQAPRPELLKVGTVAPDFASMDLANKPVKLSDFKDKVVVLDYWATWCGPCMKSLPHTQEAAKQYKDQGVVVLAVCTSDERAAFEKWTKANQSKYPDIQFTCDPNERGSVSYTNRASLKLYGVSGIPTQFVIGRDGKVVASVVGYPDGDVRLEGALARAGIKVDPALAAKGEAELRKREQ